MPDNRLPTNQSQLDIAEELSNIKLAIQQLFAMQNKTDLTTIAPAENQIASAAHLTDDIFTYNGGLYQATEDIAIGDDITNKITQISTTSYVNPTRMNHIEDGIENSATKSDLNGTTVGVAVITSSGNPRATNLVNKSRITGKQVIINVTFTSAITASNSPGMVYIQSNVPKIFSALSCVRLASNGDIEAVVGAYSLTNGTIYVKEVTNGSNYVLTGCYAID